MESRVPFDQCCSGGTRSSEHRPVASHHDFDGGQTAFDGDAFSCRHLHAARSSALPGVLRGLGAARRALAPALPTPARGLDPERSGVIGYDALRDLRALHSLATPASRRAETPRLGRAGPHRGRRRLPAERAGVAPARGGARTDATRCAARIGAHAARRAARRLADRGPAPGEPTGWSVSRERVADPGVAERERDRAPGTLL